MKKTVLSFLILSLFILLSAGCSSSEEGANTNTKTPPKSGETEKSGEDNAPTAKEKNTDPVTLTIFTEVALTDEEFDEFIAAPVQKDNPHISFELIRRTPDLILDDLIVSGEIPDMVYGGPNLFNYLDLDYPLDLSAALKEHNIDISRIAPSVIDSIKTYGKNGEIYGIPFTMNSYALWYNKGIFNKFGVDYPTDGMTWEEAIDLGKKVTGVDGGVQYRGIDIMNTNIGKFAEPLEIELVNRDTMEPIISDKWNELFDMVMRSYNIPGNDRGEKPRMFNLPPFTKDQNLAMATFWTNGMVSNLPKTEGLEWDVVQLPSFVEAPNKYIQADFAQFVISQKTKHIDAIMEVMKVAISEEIQKKATRLGRLTVLKDQNIKDQFATDIEEFQGKNVQGIFKSEPAERLVHDKYYHEVFKAINQAFFKVYGGEADANTALREAKEIASQRIAEIKAGE